jgi:hypothetical protein
MRNLVTIVLLATSAAIAPVRGDVPPPVAEASLASTLDAFSAFRMAESGRHLKGNTFKIEDLEISIVEGNATPILAKDGLIAGLWFSGSGGWTYTASGPVERAVLKTNTDRVARGLRPTTDGVAAYFKEMIVIFSTPLWQDGWSPASVDGAEAPPSGSAARVDDATKLIRSSVPEIGFRLAQSRLNGFGRYVYVEFIGGSERIGYLLDDVDAHDEMIFGFRKLANYHARFMETI